MVKEHEEIHEVQRFIDKPSESPEEFMTQMAVKCYMDGVDAEAVLTELFGAQDAFFACRAGRLYLNKHRAQLRRYVHGRPQAKKREFTTENFRITIDTTQSKDYGMVNVSIYCMVEIWSDEDQNAAEKEYLVNFSDYKTKEWLTRLLVWGLMNKREVVIKPATEEEMSSMKMFIPKDHVA